MPQLYSSGRLIMQRGVFRNGFGEGDLGDAYENGYIAVRTLL
jgi:hypothetical protein